MSDDRKIRRRLNDELRVHLLGGGTLVSPKIAALDLPTLRRIIEQLALYDDFCEATDPSGEHASGAFDFEGATVIFEIVVEPIKEALETSLFEPPGAERLMTIMLAEEYALLTCNESRFTTTKSR